MCNPGRGIAGHLVIGIVRAIRGISLKSLTSHEMAADLEALVKLAAPPSLLHDDPLGAPASKAMHWSETQLLIRWMSGSFRREGSFGHPLEPLNLNGTTGFRPVRPLQSEKNG
jgi:hypothetical protein